MRNLLHLVAFGALILGPLAARAEGSAAEALFLEGRAALENGDYETACRKFQASLDVSGAIGPLLNLADCEEKRGRLATALSLWQKGAARLADKPKDERRKVVQERIEVLEERAPTISLSLAPGAPPGTRVRVDGAEVADLSRPIPLDPGDHEVIASAKGREDDRATVTLFPGNHRTLAIAPGRPIGGDLVAPVRGGSGGGGGGGLRTAGFIAGGVGIAGLAAFGVTGGLMLAKKSVVDDHCDASRRCDQEGADAAEAGRTLGIVNGIALGVGLAGVALGTTLIVIGGGEEQGAATVGITALPGGGALSVGGRL
ncbi:MAG: hypothetical protein IT372_30900 [Polyangiaceae bacterium]|nr:hypothetical protein [Polyangiaceae bacterium]